jgi:hypothetical protein
MTLPSNKSSVIAGSLQEYDTIAIKNTINRFELIHCFVLKRCNKYQSESKSGCKVQENSRPFQQ